MLLKLGTTRAIPVYMANVAGSAEPDLQPQDFVRAVSKDSGGMVSSPGTITNLGAGWYSVLLQGPDTDTSGVLTVVLSHSSGLVKQAVLQVVVCESVEDNMDYLLL